MSMHHRHSFFWDTNVGEFLFPGLDINGVSALVGLGVVLLLLTILYEALKVVQTQARAKAARERQRVPACRASETATLLTRNSNNGRSGPTLSKKWGRITGQATIFLFHTTLGYILMLAVMVYNGYVFILVILGMGLGYFFFGHISMKINMENIRARTTNVICSPRCPDEPSTSRIEDPTRAGYINEVASNCSEDSSNDTQSSQLPGVEVLPYNSSEVNVIHSCRL